MRVIGCLQSEYRPHNGRFCAPDFSSTDQGEPDRQWLSADWSHCHTDCHISVLIPFADHQSAFEKLSQQHKNADVSHFRAKLLNDQRMVKCVETFGRPTADDSGE